ncbi:MDR family MFS transporter [Phycicoccus sonneratiae]|uniref:MDR family MFS transporter n=1 Tax=Phycicoccus sonneratiae TaxID=2807628 RepID=UPI0027DD9525|nr:MDR family MFS transporter [Phycicoccus sonneraticus]
MSSPSTTRVPRASVGLRSERGPVLLSVMLSTGLVAIDATILATAVPAVVRDLGGLSQFPWLFSVYVLAQAVSVPVYGKVADLFGRKTVMLVGVGLFVLGSLLCGLAWSMGALIAFRAVQGLGAGAIQPIGMTIVGDLYTVAERATVQGYIASVWAVSSLVGPTLGGVFSEALTWRWIFFVNLPLGAAAAWMLWRRFSETPRPAAERPRIDVAGTLLLLLGTVALLVALLEGGVLWAWSSPTSVALFVAAVVLLAAFVAVERRAAEPVLPLWVFGHRVVGGAMLVSLVVGVMLLGLTSYVPLYAQGVLGTGAIVAGFALAAMTMGWPVAASTAGRLYLRLGFRTTLLIGSVLAVAGSGLLLAVGPDSSVWLLAGACLVLGLGFGYVASPSLVAAQSSVPWHQRGVATSASIFARSVGSAVGVAAFGAVANTVVRSRLGHNPSDLESLPPGVLGPALGTVFAVAAGVSVTMLLASLVMPREVHEVEATTPS